MAIEIPPVPSASSALTDGEGRATRPLQSFLNAIRTAFATAIDSLLPIHLTEANTVEQYNSTTAQAWNLYNTRTSATNYERLGVSWASNVIKLNSEIGSGGGTRRNLCMQTAGGNVGIGTAAPVSFGGGYNVLDLTSQSATDGGVFHVSTAGGTYTADIFVGSVFGAAVFRTGTVHSLILQTNSTHALWIDTSQRVAVGGATPDASAQFEVKSTTRGLLLPRMTTAQRDAIGTPAEGLLVYNTSTLKLNFRDNGAWRVVTSV